MPAGMMVSIHGNITLVPLLVSVYISLIYIQISVGKIFGRIFGIKIMTRKEERVQYAMSFEGKEMENEELKENIRLAILSGAIWADKTMIEKASKWIATHLLGLGTAEYLDEFKKAMEE